MKIPKRSILVASILLLAVGSDQLLKAVAHGVLRFTAPISILDDFIILQYAENRGIMMSIGATLPSEIRFWIFTVAVAILLAGISVYVLVSRSVESYQAVCWSMVIAGGVGNLLDRLFRDGVVVDFVSVGFGPVRTAVFNLADALVFLGVVLLLLRGVVRQERPGGSAGEQDASPTGPPHDR